MKIAYGVITAAALAALSGAGVSLAQTPKFPSAEDSDPVKLGWMVGSPPAADKLVQFANGSFYSFPRFRWSFSNARRLGPTTNVSHGLGATSKLAKAERNDIDALTFAVMGTGETMSWAQSLQANYTDGIIVLHRGKIVYERYFGVLTTATQHTGHSVTKSFTGTLAAMLIADGTLDENALGSNYVPELKDTAFGNATVRQILDMTTGLKYSENYADPKAEVWDHVRAGGILPRPPGYNGPKTFYEFFCRPCNQRASMVRSSPTRR
jgi:CubicO group peptidase (beta-lactamase class C family)